MKKRMLGSLSRPLVFLFLLFLAPLSMSAQAYGTAVGARVADGWGLTLQQQVAVHTTVEGILQRGLKTQDITFIIMGEQHKSLLTRGFNVYFGGGLYKTWLETVTTGTQPDNPWGITGVGGLEITIGNINASADFLPVIKLGGDSKASGFQFKTGISIRYVMAGRYFKDESWKFWQKWTKPKKKK
jgi:hypothetical protein